MTDESQADQAADNLRAIGLLVISMGVFAIEDSFIKIASSNVSIYQIIVFLGISGAIFCGIMLWRRRKSIAFNALLHPILLARASFEVLGTYGFITALALIPLSSASAILQATPLVVTLAAALFLKETVGWRRWAAMLVGFAGVLLVIRPGSSAFDVNSLYAVLGVIGLAGRDVFTRRIPKSIPTSLVAFQAFMAVTALGLIPIWFTDLDWTPMSRGDTAWIVAASAAGIAGYFAITSAMRIGEVSAIAPFRYTRIIFALILGYVLFNERPDQWMLAGCSLIVGAGVYAWHRERLLKIQRTLPIRGR